MPGKGTGANIYNSVVKASILGRPCLVALFAISSHLSGKDEPVEIYGNPVRPLDEIVRHIVAPGVEDHVRIGSLEIASRYTLETAVYEYLLYIEDEASFVCYVRERRSEAEYRAMVERLAKLAEAGLIAGHPSRRRRVLRPQAFHDPRFPPRGPRADPPALRRQASRGHRGAFRARYTTTASISSSSSRRRTSGRRRTC